MNKKSNRFSPEVRERAVRMVHEHRGVEIGSYKKPVPQPSSTTAAESGNADQPKVATILLKRRHAASERRI